MATAKKNDTGKFVIPSEGGGIQSTSPEINKRVNNVENLTRAILYVTVATLVSTLVAVAAVVIDQLHFNYQVNEDRKKEFTSQIDDSSTRIKNLEDALNSAELKAKALEVQMNSLKN